MKIVALNGMLGYGYSEKALYRAFEERPDYVGVDAGSTDPGPYYLGSGESFTDRDMVKRDLSLVMPLVLKSHTPLIIGTDGGSGSSVHMKWLTDIIKEISAEKGFSFRMGLIYTDVSKDYLIGKLEKGKIIPMGRQLKLSERDIRESVRIVSQIGVDPFIHMLKQGVDIIVAGRACDTAIYAAPCIMNGYSLGLSYHMAKIMECGAMCSEPMTAADVMQGYMEADHFDLMPANPCRRCTVERVAAHTMYEQADPYIIYEPDGTVDLKDAKYTQINNDTVRVSGSSFTEAERKTLKIEGVRLSGYRTICMGGIKDPETSARIDDLFESAKAFIDENIGSEIRKKGGYSINLIKYGMPLHPALPENDIGIIIDTVGSTQQIADTVCALARARLLHSDYTDDRTGIKRKSTAGNIAFPFSPSDIHAGEIYEFNIFHLAEAEDLTETCRFEYETIGESVIK